MLDITKKYWINFGNYTVLCSITNAHVIANKNSIKDLKISEAAKIYFNKQEEPIAHSYPNEPESFGYLEEMEKLGYVVFYDVDEPVGHALNDDELEEFAGYEEVEDDYVADVNELNEFRKIRIDSILSTWKKHDAEAIFDIVYPEKEYGVSWFKNSNLTLEEYING